MKRKITELETYRNSLLNKEDIDNCNKTVDDLSLEELEDVGELYKFEVSKLSSEVKRLERENLILKRIINSNK